MVSFCEVTESVEFEASQSVAELNAEANATTSQLKPEQNPPLVESSTPKRRRTSNIQQETSFRGLCDLQLLELGSSQNKPNHTTKIPHQRRWLCTRYYPHGKRIKHPFIEMSTKQREEEDGVAEAPLPEKEENDDDEEEETTTATATGAKKKKKNKKKKRPAAAAFNVFAVSDEDFAKYCQTALDAIKPNVSDVNHQIKLVEKYASMFKHFPFTGELRPGFVTPRITYPASIPAPDYAFGGQPISEQLQDRRTATIHVHTEEEIAKIRRACMLGREVLDIAGRFCRAGVSGDEIDRVVTYACIERNVYPSPLNYYDFPKSVCVSVNEVICHGIPDSRKLKDGDIVNIDVSVYVDGVHADLNDMYLVGNVDQEGLGLVKAAYDTLAMCCKMIKPGAFYRDFGTEITKIATKANCAVVKKYSGHGVGLQFHCNPTIPHYANNKAVGILRAGHVFTIEPMLNVGSNWGDMTWPDNWTASTKDGKRSAQFEHTFLVTETGVEILTAGPGMSKTEMTWDATLLSRLQRPGD
ncbi:methionine aminopeptidase, type I [Batrachochytrium salamandrivorans]|nr:methionine aminopeptidase, type I [Batrachochytrium salamandrivorans]